MSLRVRLEDLRRTPRPLPADALARCARALQAAAARLGVTLDGEGTAPLPTWTVLVLEPSRLAGYYDLTGRVRGPGQGVEDLTWAAGTAVSAAALEDDGLTVLAHGAGHWLGHHRLGVACDEPEMWRASERLARRAEGPSWLARLFGRVDPGAALLT